MAIDTTYRSNDTEIMDDFGIGGTTLYDALDKISDINRLLGGNEVTLQGIQTLINNIPKEREITIVDIGCGNGEMLRMIAAFGNKTGRQFKLIGIDANLFSINYAVSLSTKYPNITYFTNDIFEGILDEIKYDIALFTLTLHHFNESDILKVMEVLNRRTEVGIVINDLHRSKLAYRLFQFICIVFNINKMPKEDGLLSILKGFKREELVAFSEKLKFNNYKIRWKWAFRYQWIISKL